MGFVGGSCFIRPGSVYSKNLQSPYGTSSHTFVFCFCSDSKSVLSLAGLDSFSRFHLLGRGRLASFPCYLEAEKSFSVKLP